MITRMCGARHVLEIGCFTGYSALCFAYGVGEGGQVDTLEINDELEELTRSGWERSGVGDRICLHLGDALESIGRTTRASKEKALVESVILS